MAIDGVVDLIEVVGRFFGRVVSEVIIEFLCKGGGYFICRKFNKDINPDCFTVFLVGFIFWITIALLLFATYEFLLFQLEIDRCLDSGGRFDHLSSKCGYD